MGAGKVTYRALQRARRKAGKGFRGLVTVKQHAMKTKTGVVVVKEHTRTNSNQIAGMSRADYRARTKSALSRSKQIQSTRSRALKGMY
jgi:hypothetical protein